MRKIKKLLFLVCCVFGLLLSINSLSVKACDENVINVIVSEELSFTRESINKDCEINVLNNDIIIKDDNNPDGVFLMKISETDLEKK